MKLIPDRPWAVRGLVPLADAMNIARAGDGTWAIAGLAPPPNAYGEVAPMRSFNYVGGRLTRTRVSPVSVIPGPVSSFTVHLGTFDEMRAADKAWVP